MGGHPGLEKWEFTEKLLSGKGHAGGYFIGDSVHDMQAGKRNGLGTIFADYGYGSCADQSLIDHHLDNIAHLPRLLDHI